MSNAILILDEQQEKTGMKNCLSTGTDNIVHHVIRTRQLEQAYRERRKLVVLDATRSGMAYGIVQMNGYHIAGTIPGDKQYFNIFEGNDSMVMYKFRRLLQIAGYNELEIQKSLAYICFLQHVLSIGNGLKDKLSIDLICKFSSNIAFEHYVNGLFKNHIINQKEQMVILSKYSELAAISIDLEATILNFSCAMGLRNTNKVALSDIAAGEALYFHIGGYYDNMIQNALLSMILFDINEPVNKRTAIFVMADGIREDQRVSEFLEEVPRSIPCIFETLDIFAIEQKNWERMMDKFDICVFSKHSSMHSCELCEQQFGTMEIYKNNYTVDYDRHLQAFSFLDKILGKDKIEHYGKTPAWEPVYRKEDIYSMMPGMAIISFAGNSQLVQCNY